MSFAHFCILFMCVCFRAWHTELLRDLIYSFSASPHLAWDKTLRTGYFPGNINYVILQWSWIVGKRKRRKREGEELKK